MGEGERRLWSERDVSVGWQFERRGQRRAEV